MRPAGDSLIGGMVEIPVESMAQTGERKELTHFPARDKTVMQLNGLLVGCRLIGRSVQQQYRGRNIANVLDARSFDGTQCIVTEIGIPIGGVLSGMIQVLIILSIEQARRHSRDRQWSNPSGSTHHHYPR